MYSGNSCKKKLLHSATKVAAFVVVVMLVFSPVGNIFGTPPQAHAAPYPDGYYQAVPGGIYFPNQAGNPVLDQSGNTVPTTKSSACSLTGNWDICITNIVYFIAVGLGSALAYLGAYVLNFAAGLTLDSAAYGLSFISTSWQSVRDLANMAFIFILIYIAFTIMFRAETTNTVKMLAWVIAIALVVNFSFFLTRLVIDGGNILAVQFYNSIPSISSSASTGQCQNVLFSFGCNSKYKDLTAGIMNAVQVQNLFSPDSLKSITGGNSTWDKWMVNVIVLSFMYLSVGVVFWTLFTVFISVGIKFLIRIVLLWFAIILSPFALVARTIKKTEPYYYQWQDLLVKNAFYPAFFFLIFAILSGVTTSIAGGDLAQTALSINHVSGASSSAFLGNLAGQIGNIAIRLGFICLVIYVGLKFADSAGTYGAGLARKVTSFSGNAVFGATGFGLRNTLGYAGNAFSRSATGRNLGTNAGFVGRTLWRGADALGRGSLDLRNVGTARRVLNTAGSVDLKEGRGRGGFNASYEARVDRRMREAEGLKPQQYQIEEAETKAINTLADSEKTMLKSAADAFAQAQKSFKDGLINKTELEQARKTYGDTFKNLGIEDKLRKARESAGAGNAKAFAEGISTYNTGNLGGRTSGLFALNRADREAAARIRNAASESERISSYLKNIKVSVAAPTTVTPAAPVAATRLAGAAYGVVQKPSVSPQAVTTKPQTLPHGVNERKLSEEQLGQFRQVLRKELKKTQEKTAEAVAERTHTSNPAQLSAPAPAPSAETNGEADIREAA